MAIARRLRQFVGRARGGVWFGRPYLTPFPLLFLCFFKGFIAGNILRNVWIRTKEADFDLLKHTIYITNQNKI